LKIAARVPTMTGVSPKSATKSLPLHPNAEMQCRRCEVHCDKVVYPGACLEKSCPFVYSYEAWGQTYVGCMQKVYEVEIDLDMLRAAERRSAGFGAIRAVREPLPMCKTEIESTYASRSDETGCVNPEFGELPVGEPTFRVFAHIKTS
jgi:hypothetical protein